MNGILNVIPKYLAPLIIVFLFASHTEKTEELPTSLPMGCMWATEWASHGLPLRILPCKLGCPLLSYKVTIGSSVVSPLLPNTKKAGSGVGYPWAADFSFPYGLLPYVWLNHLLSFSASFYIRMLIILVNILSLIPLARFIEYPILYTS